MIPEAQSAIVMKTILFVDDEPFVLEGIRRMMRKESDRWEAHFANSGEEAIDLLTNRKFDLLITDMKMPGVDGAGLLSAAEVIRPDMPRIALSGYSEKETHVRITASAQMFLSKPCDSGELKRAIESILSGLSHSA